MNRIVGAIVRFVRWYASAYPSFEPKRTARRNFERTARAIERMYSSPEKMMRSHFEAAGGYMRRAVRRGV